MDTHDSTELHVYLLIETTYSANRNEQSMPMTKTSGSQIFHQSMTSEILIG